MAVVAAKIFAHFLFDFQKYLRKFDENLVNNILPYRFVLSFVHSILLLKPDIFHVIPLEASEGLFSPKDFLKQISNWLVWGFKVVFYKIRRDIALFFL